MYVLCAAVGRKDRGWAGEGRWANAAALAEKDRNFQTYVYSRQLSAARLDRQAMMKMTRQASSNSAAAYSEPRFQAGPAEGLHTRLSLRSIPVKVAGWAATGSRHAADVAAPMVAPASYLHGAAHDYLTSHYLFSMPLYMLNAISSILLACIQQCSSFRQQRSC